MSRTLRLINSTDTVDLVGSKLQVNYSVNRKPGSIDIHETKDIAVHLLKPFMEDYYLDTAVGYKAIPVCHYASFYILCDIRVKTPEDKYLDQLIHHLEL